MTTNFLEKLAYIMVIIVCFAILCTLFLYISCFLIRHQKEKKKKNLGNKSDCKTEGSLNGVNTCCSTRKRDEEDGVNNLDDIISIDSRKCNSCFEFTNKNNNDDENNTINENKNNENRPSTLLLNKKFKLNSENKSNIVVSSQNSSMMGTETRKKSLTDLPDLDGKMLSNNDGVITSFFNGFKAFFYGSSNINPDLVNSTSTMSPIYYNNNSSDKAQTTLKSNIKKSTSNLRKDRRNSSIQSAHSVKFKENYQYDSSSCDNTDMSSEDECYGSMTNSKKPSLTSTQSSYMSAIDSNGSRKNSSSTTSTNSSVVDLYKKKRYSDASLYTANSNRSNSLTSSSVTTKFDKLRKLSVNPYIEPGIKLVTLEQQTHLSSNTADLEVNKKKDRKDSSVAAATSTTSKARSKFYSNIANGNMDRRYSVMTNSLISPTTNSNMSEKFWVPDNICSKLEKQRASLPTVTATSSSFNNKNSISLLLNNKKHYLDADETNTEETKDKMEREEPIQMNILNNHRDIDENNNSSSVEQQQSQQNQPSSLNRHGSLMAHAHTMQSVPNRRRASMFDPIDPTELQKTLYKSNKVSNTCGHMDSSSEMAVIGTIEFAIEYLNESQKLIVEILRIFDLNFDDENSSACTSPTLINSFNIGNNLLNSNNLNNGNNNIIANGDLYCKCTLMPDKNSYETKLAKQAPNLVFDEKFEYDNLDVQKLEMRYLEISIHEIDKSSNDNCIGVCFLKLNHSAIEKKNIFVKELRPASKSNENKNYIGDLMFSLAYLPAAERLTIIVMKARNLSRIGADKKPPDSYVKIRIFGKDGKKLKKKKTSTQKSSTIPIFNEEIVFTNLKKDQLNDITINFTIYHDSITNKEALGFVEINSASKGNEYIQWRDMIAGKKSIAWWHALVSIPSTNSDSDHSTINEGSSKTFSLITKNSSSNLHSNSSTNNSNKNINMAKFNLKSLSLLNNR